MTPKCFKQAAYYREWAIRCIKEVDTRWLDYDTVWKAICHKTGNLHGIFDSYGHYEWFSKHADDAMADKAMELEPNLFTDFPDGSGHRKDLFMHLKRKEKSTVITSILSRT